jgi:hypothetical protein
MHTLAVLRGHAFLRIFAAVPPASAHGRTKQVNEPLAAMIDAKALTKTLALAGSTTMYPKGFINDFGAHSPWSCRRRGCGGVPTI